MIKAIFAIIIVGVIALWGADYTSLALARMTHDDSWLTKSIVRDRVLNGLRYDARPYDDPISGVTMIRFTLVNSSKYRFVGTAWGMCGYVEGSPRLDNWSGEVELDLPPYATTSVSVSTKMLERTHSWLDGFNLSSSGEELSSRWGCSLDLYS